jgi:hypothetical protein
MAKLAIKKASTDVTTYVFIQDSSKTTGEGLAGLAYNTASLVASYVRPLGTRQAITLATLAAADSAHSDGGFKEVDATNMPGVYRLDLPDAVCATGVNSVVVMLKGATNMSPVVLEIQLTDFDLNTAAITAAGVADAVWDEATADHTTASSFGALDANVDAILADTGTDGVKIASAQTVATVTNLTNLPTMPTDWVTAAGLKADAVTEIQSGLALEATLTAIKGAGWDIQTLNGIYNLLSAGFNSSSVEDTVNAALAPIYGAGWTNETLVKIVTDIAAISAGSGATAQEVWEYATRVLTAGTNIDLSALATAADLATLDGKVDTVDGILDDLHDTDIPAIKTETAAIKAKTDLIPASPAEAGEYTAAIAAVKSVADDILVDTGTTLDALIKDIPTNAELTTALGTADDAVLAAVAAAKVVIDDIHDTDLPAVKAETALIVEDTGTTIPATLEAIDNFIDTEVAAILEDTGTTIPTTLATIAGYTDGIAGDVWSHPIRTLTVPAVAMSDPEDGTTLTLYKDADINIEFTGLTIPTGAKKVVFTIKDNLDDADTAAALQATYQLTAVPAETHTLNYINSATPPTLTNPVTFTVTTDSVEFDMTAAAAYYLPRYERGYLKWDLKLITATTVQILQQGLVQILGTSTRTVA